MNAPRWFTEADVTSTLDLPTAIDALERVLAAEHSGGAENMTKTHLMVGDNDVLNALGGALHTQGLCGTKTWVNVRGRSQTLLVLFSLTDGAVRAVLEATALGQIRTAAMTGLGTRWLASADAAEMAIVGTGKQALPQIAACCRVRPVRRVRVFARDRDKLRAFVEGAAAALPGVDVVAAESLREAVADVPIVTLCTNATAPFLAAELLAPGTHVNAIGAIVPRRVEFHLDLFARCDLVAVDSLAAVRELSREFIDHFGAGRASWDSVTPLSRLIAEGRSRPPGADVTLFKAMGMGIADLAVAAAVLEHASGQGLPERVRCPLEL